MNLLRSIGSFMFHENEPWFPYKGWEHKGNLGFPIKLISLFFLFLFIYYSFIYIKWSKTLSVVIKLKVTLARTTPLLIKLDSHRLLSKFMLRLSNFSAAIDVMLSLSMATLSLVSFAANSLANSNILISFPLTLSFSSVFTIGLLINLSLTFFSFINTMTYLFYLNSILHSSTLPFYPLPISHYLILSTTTTTSTSTTSTTTYTSNSTSNSTSISYNYLQGTKVPLYEPSFYANTGAPTPCIILIIVGD